MDFNGTDTRNFEYPALNYSMGFSINGQGRRCFSLNVLLRKYAMNSGLLKTSSSVFSRIFESEK